MTFIATGDGIKPAHGFKFYIGKDANESMEEITKERSYKNVLDCIGLNGYRNITMWGNGHHIEIICKTDCVDDIVNKRIDPSQASWTVEDIFLYDDRPKKGYGFY